jgi:hypothetical protein
VGTIMITLKRVRNNEYALFGPKGNQISEIFRGNRLQAKDWAVKWVSSFHNWGVDSKEIDDEEAPGVPE